MGRDLATVVAAVLGAVPPGAVMVQLREKDLSDCELLALARRLVEITRPCCAPLLINDRLDIALAAGASGVHLPERGMDVATARAVGGPDLLIGVSTHGTDSAVAAAQAGADVVVCGPLWATPSKAGMGAPLGPDGLRAVCNRVAAAAAAPSRARLYALGGITDVARARAAMAAGVHGIAGIRAFMAAPDPARAAAELYQALTSLR